MSEGTTADGRGPHTQLTARVLAHFGVARSQDLVREIYHGAFEPATVAAIAPQVEAAAAEGDDIALYLIDTGARELGLAALSVCHMLRLSHGPVILAGGMFKAAPRMRQRVAAHLTGRWTQTPTNWLGPANACRSGLSPAEGTFVL